MIISASDFDSETIEMLKKANKKLCFIAPDKFHKLYLKSMKNIFSSAEFYGPSRAAKQSRVDLKAVHQLETNTITPIPIEGCDILSETCFYQTSTKSLFVADLFFKMHHKMNLPMKLMMKLVDGYHQLNTSRSIRMSIKNEEKFINSIKNLKELEVERVIPCHGDEINREEFLTWSKLLIKSLK